MKKINKANKLLLNSETVRSLDSNEMQGVVGGASTDSAQSAGSSKPGPSHSDGDYAAMQSIANAGYVNYASLANVNLYGG